MPAQTLSAETGSGRMLLQCCYKLAIVQTCRGQNAALLWLCTAVASNCLSAGKLSDCAPWYARSRSVVSSGYALALLC